MVNSLFFIGDLHGQHRKLAELLVHLDFIPDEPASDYSVSKLIFLGDLIDNGLQSGVDHIAALNLVKSHCDTGKALCVLGNHEFNAVGWWLTHPLTGAPLRAHDKPGNREQHACFLQQVGEGSDEHRYWVEWFMSLPLYLDLGPVRAIHACWDESALARLQPYLNADKSLKREHWVDAFDRAHELFELCEILLKGPEKTLPAGTTFQDRMGKTRNATRLRCGPSRPKPAVT